MNDLSKLVLSRDMLSLCAKIIFHLFALDTHFKVKKLSIHTGKEVGHNFLTWKY